MWSRLTANYFLRDDLELLIYLFPPPDGEGVHHLPTFYVVLGIKPRTSCIPDKWSIN